MKAIAIQPVWNHITQTLVEKDKEFEMDDISVLSLMEIGAVKAVTNDVKQAEPEPTPTPAL